MILIHGLASSAFINWQLTGTIKLLAAHFQVIALDVRGHGESEKPVEEDDYGLNMVGDVSRLMDHLGLEQAHIVGYSLGGMIAARFAVDHPQRVRSLTLGGMGWFRQGSSLQKFWETLPKREKNRSASACVRSVGKLAVSQAELEALTMPAEVLVGSKDPCRQLYVNPLRPVRPDWPVIEIKDAGHFNCIFNDDFKQQLLQWLVRQAPQDGSPGADDTSPQ